MPRPPDDRRAYDVLFLCTGNSARSLMAEATLARLGAPRYRAFSAGSQPKSAPHPMALEVLRSRGYETSGLRSKSWDEFAGTESPPLDFIVTVCANAARETCPIWPGRPITAHWGVDDPAAFAGTPERTRAFFEQIHDALRARIEALVELDPSSLDAAEFARRVQAIGDR
jgi:protein-tyrosine-phosphatase